MRLSWAMFYRELLRIPKAKYFYWKRSLFLVFIFFIFFYSVLSANNVRGLWFITSFFMGALTLLLFSLPVNAAMSIYEEKEKRTLPLLLITDLGANQVVYGKFIFRSFQGILMFLSCLPIIMFAISLGGVSGQQIIAALVSLLSFILFATALGLATASFFNDQGTPNLALWFVLLYIIVATICQVMTLRPVWGQFSVPLSPYVCFGLAFFRNSLAPCYWNALIQVSLSIVLLVFACKVLPRSVLYEKPVKEPKLAIRSSVVNRKSKMVKNNPVFWRDYQKTFGGNKKNFIRVCLVIVVWLAIVWFISNNSGEIGIEAFFVIGLIISSMAAFLFMLSNSIRSFSREKEQRTIDALFCSTLSNRQIVTEKIVSILYACFPIVLIAITCFYIAVILPIYEEYLFTYGLSERINEAWLTFAYLVSLAFFLSCIAVYISARCKTARKAGNVMGVVIITLYIIHMLAIFIIEEMFYESKIFSKATICTIFLYLLVIWNFLASAVKNLRTFN